MMKLLQKSKLIFLTLLSFAVTYTQAYGQIKSFRFKADLQKIDSGGVYRIALKPELIAKSNSSLSDIRIVDHTGKNIAYVLSNKLTLDKPDSFIIFPEIANANLNDDTTVIYIAANNNKLDVNQLWIKLKNAAVNRMVNLSGSDDLKKWFAIKEDILLEEAGEVKSTDYMQSLQFSVSNYRYFKLIVDGKHKTPVNILQAGVYTQSLDQPVYSSLPPFKFTVKESDKITHIFIDLKEPYQLNKIHLAVTSPKYYSRRVVIYADDKKQPTDDSNSAVADTVLKSSGSQEINLSVKVLHVRVDIFNGDDNPLVIQSISGFQNNLYAVCYLDSGIRYAIYTGSPNVKTPDYDLSFLDNRAYNQLPYINHFAIHENQAYALAAPLTQTSHTEWLWAVLLVVLLLLCFLTFRMTRELK